MPSKLRYKLVISFCLMSLLPILAGAYVASLFIKFPFVVNGTNLASISLVLLFSLTLSFLGYRVTRELIRPILDVTATAQSIAAGKLNEVSKIQATDEWEDLSRSLRTISKNARELLDKVEKLSLKDKLTGLYNATYIRERLSEEIHRARHYQRPCSFAYFVVNQFQEYAHRFGEAASEDLLKAAAKVLSSHLAEFDRAARITNEEFVIIFPDKNKKKSMEIVEKIGRDMTLLPFMKSHDFTLSLSVGISENPMDGVQADELYIKAQDRMNLARSGGKLMEAFA